MKKIIVVAILVLCGMRDGTTTFSELQGISRVAKMIYEQRQDDARAREA